MCTVTEMTTEIGHWVCKPSQDKEAHPKPGRTSYSQDPGFWPGVLGFTDYRQTRCLDLTLVTLRSRQVICPSGEVSISPYSTPLVKLKLSPLFTVIQIVWNNSISEIEKCIMINIPEYCAHSIIHREMTLVRVRMSFLSPGQYFTPQNTQSSLISEVAKIICLAATHCLTTKSSL